MSSLLDLIDPKEAVVDFHGLRFDHTHAEATRQAVDVASMSADFVIVTTRQNYHGNAHQIMESKLGKGMQTERHEANPVVLLEHGFGGIQFPAIGLSKDKQGKYTVKKQKTKATATVFFSQSNPDAATVFAMVDEGVLHMASIGFDALKGVAMKQQKPAELPEGVMELCWNSRGILFTETELVEWSITAQGADAGAVRQYLDRGKVVTEKLTDSMRAYLQAIAPRVAWSPGFDLESFEAGRIDIDDWRRQRAQEESEKRQVHFPSTAYGVVVSAENPEAVQRAIQALDKQSEIDKKAQSALDTKTPANTVLPTGGGADGGLALPNQPLPTVNLAAEWEQREASRKQQQESQKRFFQHLEKSIEAKFDAATGELREVKNELKRLTGVID